MSSIMWKTFEMRFEWEGPTPPSRVRQVVETRTRKLLTKMVRGVGGVRIHFDEGNIVIRFNLPILTSGGRTRDGEKGRLNRVYDIVLPHVEQFVVDENKKADLRRRRKEAAKRSSANTTARRPAQENPARALDVLMRRPGLLDVPSAGAMSVTSRWHRHLYRPNGTYWTGLGIQLGLTRSKRARKTWKRLVFEYIRKGLLSKSAYRLVSGGLIKPRKTKNKNATVT